MRDVLLCAVGLGLAALASGCGHDDMMDMADHGSDLDAHLEQYRGELGAHHAAVLDASALEAIAGEEERHHRRAEDHEAAMMHGMAEGMSCMGPGGERPDLAAMWDAMTAGRAERAEHRQRMAAATELAAARVEESRHRAAMAAMMSELDGHVGAMMGDDARMYHCPGHH
jgi:hypothetical protein